jgi:hypothetical protein
MTKRKSVTEDWPRFEAPLLQEIAAAFSRRRKAIAYSAGLSCTREFSESASGVVERLNLDLRAGDLRVSVWADGLMWLGIAIPKLGRNAGWAFQDSFHGDTRDISPATLVAMVEATLLQQLGSDQIGERQRLRDLWMRVAPRSG